MITASAFQKKIYSHYKSAKRVLPWRRTHDPYKILISEIMLQQTQASRVIPKYTEFLKRFPTIGDLSKGNTADVLSVWQGLGYNRRALMLARLAKVVAGEYKGVFPKTYEALLELPGIGPYTAGAIMAFGYNKPQVIIETNIRTVFIYFFFPTQKKVSDKEIIPLIEKYNDTTNPREWYNALMDYGAMLKQTEVNPSRASAHHIKQSAFKGSNRQVRGAIIKLYTESPKISLSILVKKLPYSKEVIKTQYQRLKKEGFFV